jgi:hypothetical protein
MSSTVNRHLEELIRELGINPSGDSAENDRPEPTDEKQETMSPEPPQRNALSPLREQQGEVPSGSPGAQAGASLSIRSITASRIFSLETVSSGGTA